MVNTKRMDARKNITCLIGTRAQLIKMAPVILEIERRKLPLTLVFSGQHKETMEQLSADFGIRTPHTVLYEDAEITGIVQMGVWFVRCLIKVLRRGEEFIPKSGVILVHGDTFSTLLGAVLGKIRGLGVIHIEAGLRSYNPFHPFPEELTRLAVFRLSDVSFCPGEWAFSNMEKYRTHRVDMGHNTLIDAMGLALACPRRLDTNSLKDGYGICSIHRFENIFFKQRLNKIVALIEIAACHHPILFVLHPATRRKLEQYGLASRLEGNVNIQLLARMPYVEFVQLMAGARFVVTDGGGNQEELSYLNKPTLLMRRTTERREGVGSTVTVCDYSEEVLERFLMGLDQYTSSAFTPPSTSPTHTIVDYLEGMARAPHRVPGSSPKKADWRGVGRN